MLRTYQKLRLNNVHVNVKNSHAHTAAISAEICSNRFSLFNASIAESLTSRGVISNILTSCSLFVVSLAFRRSVIILTTCSNSRSERNDRSTSLCSARGPNIAYSSMIFQLKIWILGCRFPVVVFWDFLALGAKVLWRARPWQPVDGDGV